MADKRVSEEDDAGDLDGTELVRIVQSGTTKKATAQDIADLAGAGVARVFGPFPFNYDDAGLNDGIAFYTPTVNDILLDAWISVITAFNGTTPNGDVGTFVNAIDGIFSQDTPVVLSVADADNADGGYGGEGLFWNPTNTRQLSNVPGGAEHKRLAPLRFVATNPLKFVASQSGQKGGTAVGGTAGVAHVYIVVATPMLPA